MIEDRSSQDLLQLQSEILEAVARGEKIGAIAERICLRAESLAPDAICTILSVDAYGRLHPLAAPSLPKQYSATLKNLQSGPCTGSCGTAAFRREAVEVHDIETDPLWADYKALALPIGLRACWSSPIMARDRRVVGTFAFYYRSKRGPAELERRIVETCVSLCAIAIEHDEVQSRINQLAYYDGLTGLPNRTQFLELAASVLADLRPGRAVNILYIDLDDFKSVNDSLGHRVGDLLLEGVARRLLACMSDNTLVARLGGDEFAIIQCCAGGGQQEGSLLAQKIAAMLDDPFDFDEQRVSIGASIGIAQNVDVAISLAELSKQADMALYEAKNEGRRTHRFFVPAMEIAAQSRRGLKQDLRNAVDGGDFRLVYQPIVTLATNELAAVEALLRWKHPTHGEVSPAIFIPIVEEMDLIGPLGDWVLREACSAAAGWPRAIKVGVNLSPLQFRKTGFVLDVVSALHQAGLPPERLDLEVTESALLSRDIATRTALHELHDYGVRLSLDDFGTGYSSLQSLRSFPFDRIKIDMSFVRDIGMDADSSAIIRAVIRLARDLGIKTTAEGIETENQYDWLSKNGCTEGQGYWFSKPMSGAAFQALLEQPARNEELFTPTLRLVRGAG
jgi:diguanylate cyclase (GGDEF)-like protein